MGHLDQREPAETSPDTKSQMGYFQRQFMQILKWQGQPWVWESETWVLVLVLLFPGCLAIFLSVKWECCEKWQVRPMVHTQKLENPSCHNLSLRLSK